MEIGETELSNAPISKTSATKLKKEEIMAQNNNGRAKRSEKALLTPDNKKRGVA
jgi:hypothetical protein